MKVKASWRSEGGVVVKRGDTETEYETVAAAAEALGWDGEALVEAIDEAVGVWAEIEDRRN